MTCCPAYGAIAGLDGGLTRIFGSRNYQKLMSDFDGISELVSLSSTEIDAD